MEAATLTLKQGWFSNINRTCSTVNSLVRGIPLPSVTEISIFDKQIMPMYDGISWRRFFCILVFTPRCVVVTDPFVYILRQYVIFLAR